MPTPPHKTAGQINYDILGIQGLKFAIITTSPIDY